MHLNGWQRIGIVVSVCWIVIGGLWIGGLVVHELGAPAVAGLGDCIARPGHVYEICSRRYETAWSAAIADRWYYTAAYTLIPIPIVWLIVYGLVALVRWIKAGFMPWTG